jgi:hypothetical protein
MPVNNAMLDFLLAMGLTICQFTAMHKDLIKQVGGAKSLAKALGVKASAIHQWPKRGVPHRYRPAVARIAAGMGVNLPPDFFPAIGG